MGPGPPPCVLGRLPGAGTGPGSGVRGCRVEFVIKPCIRFAIFCCYKNGYFISFPGRSREQLAACRVRAPGPARARGVRVEFVIKLCMKNYDFL